MQRGLAAAAMIVAALSVLAAEIEQALARALDFRVGAMIKRLGLWSLPRDRGGRFFRGLATQGHVGRPELDLPWDSPVPLG